MLKGNQMEKAFQAAGFSRKDNKHRKGRTWTCRKCEISVKVNQDENFVVCPSCGNTYFFK